jgi:hypothetical protein
MRQSVVFEVPLPNGRLCNRPCHSVRPPQPAMSQKGPVNAKQGEEPTQHLEEAAEDGGGDQQYWK